ncbi:MULTISPECIES: O-methyltransferase [Burkholderia]|uniref:O-methyltransferase n=1 Tax=Burkholderia cenocepacia (strain ATCC BAA-245 / DSM 16553 / LMG 16656 / NCTC 13227 / J2315 / CF5610) TaxID=216591 RepID=B4EM24_BURCJ|nr:MULTISPECIES: O-methyltransferase [Burkholderia]KIS50056.1 O-methyltransferase family protein [Burkholderia cepacia]AQQ38077.1 methyltransferase [Burkholderia cenocepacia]ELW9530140.1 O-methyltransferase [Burkholderia cenocepacia]EPZ88097.1 O-methyltransferase [Burkholderia cenocepacia K56-2Valvano]ERI26969.1 O-methyltransferase [Burkholderia cenocepacia BC7]
MDQDRWNQVDAYFSATLVPSDAVLDAALAASDAAGLPAINVAPNQGKLLQLLATIRGARRILEVGTLGGYSTIWLARALPPGGALVTLELNPAHAKVATQNIARAGFAQVVSVVVGSAKDSLARLIDTGEAPFDFIFIDADKDNNAVYLDAALKLSRPGTVIVVDNVVRNGRVADPDNREPDVAGVRAGFARLAAEPALMTTAVQTVGQKGWDGFSISIVGAA